jgi:SPOR domain
MNARDHDRFEDVGLVRLTTWATAAAVALSLATLASFTTTGSQRAAAAIASLTGGSDETRQTLAQRQAEIDKERRSLNEALRLLASDRDRLLTRVASLERNLDDITGSIKSQISDRPRAETTMQEPPPELEALPVITADPPSSKSSDLDWLANVPRPWPSASSAMEFAPGPSTRSAFPPAPLPVPTPAPAVRVSALAAETQPAAASATVVTRTDFGVDIGSGSDLEEVRFLWNAAKTHHGRLLGNLRPIVVKRQDPAGNPDYRLVVGPLANAGAAAKLCATLSSADIMCSTRPYQGERLTP